MWSTLGGIAIVGAIVFYLYYAYQEPLRAAFTAPTLPPGQPQGGGVADTELPYLHMPGIAATLLDLFPAPAPGYGWQYTLDAPATPHPTLHAALLSLTEVVDGEHKALYTVDVDLGTLGVPVYGETWHTMYLAHGPTATSERALCAELAGQLDGGLRGLWWALDTGGTTTEWRFQ